MSTTGERREHSQLVSEAATKINDAKALLEFLRKTASSGQIADMDLSSVYGNLEALQAVASSLYDGGDALAGALQPGLDAARRRASEKKGPTNELQRFIVEFLDNSGSAEPVDTLLAAVHNDHDEGVSPGNLSVNLTRMVASNILYRPSRGMYAVNRGSSSPSEH